jgi:PilZ domain
MDCRPETDLAQRRGGEVWGAEMTKQKHTERRTNQRFELALPAHFRLSVKGSPSRWGTGTIHDISSTGISLRSRRPLPVGSHLELLIDWPAIHGGQYPMQLHATGFVVRSSGTKTALRIASHRFRIEHEIAQPMGAIA